MCNETTTNAGISGEVDPLETVGCRGDTLNHGRGIRRHRDGRTEGALVGHPADPSTNTATERTGRRELGSQLDAFKDLEFVFTFS